MRSLAPLALAAALGLTPLDAAAQEVPNLMIVFDASGSMWGQIGGRAKIELAREALSQVLSEADPAMQIGMIAYGHRVRGQCSDIELVVPTGPAAGTVPQMLAFANRVNPRGMTPLTDSVLMAARGLGYTEQAATVVLVTDGIETCAGDPCALGRMLAAEGIDFRAHVVGFDLTDAEQQQVSCLAEETGGIFLAANDADELRDALARTLTAEVMPEPEPEPVPEPEPEPEPAVAPRRVDLILRDVEGGPVLTGRAFRTVEVQPLDADAPPAGRIDLALNAPAQRTGRIDLLPGRYTLRLVRETQGRQVIRIALPVEIPEGADPHTVDLVIAARLQVNAFLHAGQPMPERNGRIPRLTGQGWAEFAIHPVVDGAIDASVNYGGINSQDVAVPPGDYFIRGTLTETFTREMLVQVAPGVTTAAEFDFAAAPVAVDLRDAQGFAVDRVRVEIFDLDAAEPFVSGRGRDRTEVVPAFLPEGTWRIVAREDRGGSRPAEAWVRVVPGQRFDLTLTPGAQADPAAIPEEARPLCLDTHRAHGCVVQAVTPLDIVRHLGLNGRALGAQVAPRFTGTWQTHGGMMALVQDGRRVWGEVHVNGGIGRVWGHVGPDGLTLRGAMDRSSNPRGVMELRLAPDAGTLVGFWDHNIGRMGSTITARRLSGGVPPLAVATGTDDDLRMQMNGTPWAPADSAAFAAFMELALAPASPDTGDDIDAMQQVTGPADFTGVWNTNHQQLTLQQEGRQVWGRRDRGPIWGEVSADGQTLRGIWISGPRDWGLLEFRLDPARMAFEGGWGRLRDGGTGQRWTGSRVGWLVGPQEPVTLPNEATGPVWEAFMEPVRDPGLPEPEPEPTPEPEPLGDRTEARPATGAAPDLIPAALAGFVPVARFDATHPDGRPLASLVFAARVPGGYFGAYETGFVWLHEGWCGAGCAAEILPVGGPGLDDVFNPLERLAKGGVFPALDLSGQGILAFLGDDADWPRLAVHIFELDQPYDEGTQLGTDRDRVRREFGRFPLDRIEPATLDGWPVPGAEGVQIGRIDTLPPGIYGFTLARSAAQMLRLLEDGANDPSQMVDFMQTCRGEPRVVHTDGLIATRRFDAARIAAGSAPWFTSGFMRCDQNGPWLDCAGFNRPLADNPDPADPDWGIAGPLVTGSRAGVFAIDEPNGNPMIFSSCLGPAGHIDAAARAPDGRRMIDLIADREDGGESPAFDEAGQVVGTRPNAPPAAPQRGAAPDFAALAGLYGDAAEGCASRLLAVRADGTLEVWTDLATSPATPRLTASCDAAGACQLSAGPPGAFVTLGATATGLQLCDRGDCARPQRFEACPAGQPGPDLRARILGGAAPAPAPAAAAMIPAGLWQAEAPWSDPMPPFGTPAFYERCFDEISATFPDGLTLGFQMHEGVAGPEWVVGWSETCVPSGDATWPLVCTSDDAHVADPVAAQAINRMRVLSASAQRVELSLLGPDAPQPDRFVLHSCLGPDGRGIDLTGDPRGRALVQALAGARSDGGPGLDLAAVRGGAAPAPGGPAKPPLPVAADPRPALAGLWTALRDGRRPALLTDDELAAQCFEAPGRMHADGLFVAFSLRDGVPQPEAHLRCDASLSCAYAEGGPAEGRPVQGQARLTVVTEAEVEACLGDECLSLARCPAPDWTARERAAGLPARWETAVERRD